MKGRKNEEKRIKNQKKFKNELAKKTKGGILGNMM